MLPGGSQAAELHDCRAAAKACLAFDLTVALLPQPAGRKLYLQHCWRPGRRLCNWPMGAAAAVGRRGMAVALTVKCDGACCSLVCDYITVLIITVKGLSGAPGSDVC